MSKSGNTIDSALDIKAVCCENSDDDDEHDEEIKISINENIENYYSKYGSYEKNKKVISTTIFYPHAPAPINSNSIKLQKENNTFTVSKLEILVHSKTKVLPKIDKEDRVNEPTYKWIGWVANQQPIAQTNNKTIIELDHKLTKFNEVGMKILQTKCSDTKDVIDTTNKTDKTEIGWETSKKDRKKRTIPIAKLNEPTQLTAKITQLTTKHDKQNILPPEIQIRDKVHTQQIRQFTKLCWSVSKGIKCTHPKCSFAHQETEIKIIQCDFVSCKKVIIKQSNGKKIFTNNPSTAMCRYKHIDENVSEYLQRCSPSGRVTTRSSK